MRLAFFSPLSPKPSGIADYSEALLSHLTGRLERIDVFVEDCQAAFTGGRENVGIRHYKEFEPAYRNGGYEAVLYQMGNNPFHVYIYETALRVPGIVVLHEFNLHYMFAVATVGRHDWEAYFRELEHNAGAAALERARRAQAGLQQLDYDGVAMNRSLLERSRALIVHSDYVGNLVRQAGFYLPIRKIPHGVDPGQVDAVPARQRVSELTGLALDESTPLFGIFGFLKPYKRIHEALRAFARARALHAGIKMILVGEEHPHYPLRPLIAELGIGEAVRILGYVPLETFTTCMAACDICINLRRPTAGETSGSFLRALALGKPTLVSEIGTFLELPDDVAVKIPVDDKEVEWVFEYMNVLLKDPGLARTVGARGREYARECSWPKVASQYAEFIGQCATAESALRSAQLRTAVSSAAEAPPLPSSEELEEYMIGFSHASPLMEEYVLLHRKRLAHTIEITPRGGAQQRVLELGCYLHLTPALRKYLGYGEVRGAYYGPPGRTDYRAAASAEGEVFACPVDLFDAEKDRFPYPENCFDTVLCCELIEHLSADPMHMIAEINRILVPGGALVLSTPNIASLRSAHAVLLGYHPALFPAYIKPEQDGTADPRHSREYTPREIALLMEAAGFQVELLETGDYADGRPPSGQIQKVLPADPIPPGLRGEVIYCRARKISAVRERWPKDLYYPA